MYNRPRCRDWISLATQQLRLRNLIKISGHNIACSEKCQLYFTLHSSPDVAPFYTSEKVDGKSYGTGERIDWSEINCQTIEKSTLGHVCVRVWEAGTTTNQSTGGDKVLFMWGVYFSGLIPVNKFAEIRHLTNSLEFQLNGSSFVSPEYVSTETLRQQLSFSYRNDEIYEFSTSQQAGTDNANSVPKSCDIFDSQTSLRDSVFPCNSVSGSSFDAAISDKFQINSPKTSRSCSPTQRSEENIKRNLIRMSKIRYMEKCIPKSEIRESYTLEQLLTLQRMQRNFKRVNDDSKDTTEKICTRSAFCLNLKLISDKGVFHQRSHGHSSMGRTLNRLLFEEKHLNPEELLTAQNLRREIESARFKCKILQKEHEQIAENKVNLERQLTKIYDSKIELESFLMSRFRNVSKANEQLLHEKEKLLERRTIVWRTQKALTKRRFQLCSELKEIYPIERRSDGLYTINDIVLPNAENLGNDPKFLSSSNTWEQVSPLSLSVSLGYVAHVVQMASIILDIPLRNPINHEGSRSRITDVVKEIPNVSRDFPLYSRTSIPTNPVLYAIYLLNQNIAQLNYMVNGTKCDLRATLPSVLQLLTNPFERTLIQTNRIDSEYSLYKSKSSVDLDVGSIPSIASVDDLQHIKAKMQGHSKSRISRSAGSYSDCEDIPTIRINDHPSPFYKSDSILVGQSDGGAGCKNIRTRSESKIDQDN